MQRRIAGNEAVVRDVVRDHNAPEAAVIVEHDHDTAVEKVEEGGPVADDLDSRHGS